MSKTKYIIVSIGGKTVPVIFGEEISHKSMFTGVRIGMREACRENRNGSAWEDPELVSAGFVEGLSITNVYGESESLRYGLGYIENHELTKAHPETDLPIINGAAEPKPMSPELAEIFRNNLAETNERLVARTEREKHDTHIKDILWKRDPATKHSSSAERTRVAMAYAINHLHIPDDTVSSYINMLRGQKR